MSATASQVQANLDQLTATITTVLPQAVSLLNQLASANASGTQMDPAKVQADIAAITTQVNNVVAAIQADTPATAGAAPAAAAPTSK